MQADAMRINGERLSCSAASAPPVYFLLPNPPLAGQDPLAGPEPSRAALESEYLKDLGASVATAAVTAALRNTILALVACGAEPRDLVRLATDAGFPERPVRNLISRILLEAGLRRRKPGAGPRTPPQALAIAAQARSRYGTDATRFLGAAHRVSKAQDQLQARATAQAALSIPALSLKR
jgi:hypothetical protein